MNPACLRSRRAAVLLVLAGFAATGARAQFATLLNTDARFAGNSTGTNLFNGDTGAANAISLNAPSYTALDSLGNLYLSDTANNCVRKIDSSGNVSTVAGLRVSGSTDTCNTLTNSAPTPAQGLLRPTGLTVDAANTLYISDSQHHCVRSLVSGAIDSFAANALTTVAGTCTNLDTASVTPVPNGLATDAAGNLYISIQDASAAIPVDQVLRHRPTDAATTVCYLAGQPSANVVNACAGITGTATLSSPAGLAFDVNGNLFVADTSNNCVREIVGLSTAQSATIQTAAGQCAANAGSLNRPYGLAFSPSGFLYISQIGSSSNIVLSLATGIGTLTQIAGIPSGAPGAYSSQLDGQSSLSAPLNAPLGLTADSDGNIYLADSSNNVIRRLTTGLRFPATAIGATTATQTINFEMNQAVNLTAAIGSDYTLVSTSCSGPLVPSSSPLPPSLCQASVSFAPTRPGVRSSAVLLKDSLTGNIVSVGLRGVGIGPLSLLTPGVASSFTNSLRIPIAVSVDSAGNPYVLEQGNGTSTADVLLYPAGGGPPHTVVAQGIGLQTPTAMAVDGAGNIFIADAAYGGIIRFGADGAVNTSYVTGIIDATALVVDASDNLYIAQGDVAHNVIEVYASGTRRVIAGSGTVTGADSVAAVSALFVAPSGLALGPNGLSIADASAHFVYTIDAAGTIHLVAGNGLTTTTAAGQALGTALLLPIGLAADAAGDLYIADAAANRVYEVYPTASAGVNISYPFGIGASGYAGDGGSAPYAVLNTPTSLALDGSSNLFAIDSGNSALREVTYPVTSTLDFGHIVLGTTSKVMQQAFTNAGNLGLTLPAPFTTTDPQYAISTSSTLTTCTGTLSVGGVCNVGITFSPTVVGAAPAQSNVPSISYNSPQTIQLTAIGINSQVLPYTLNPETEVYGQPFGETASINIVYPNLIPTGTMAYTIAGEITCSIAGPFSGLSTCLAPQSGLSVGMYQVNFNYTSGDLNYFSTSGTTSLSVTPAALAVTPANETKVYGAPIPALPSTITGVVNGDLFLASQTTTAIASSPIGTYPITSTLTPVGLASLSNYTVTYNPATLTITQIPLLVTVANATRAYGTASPVFSSTIAGALNGDTFTVTYSTPATLTSPAGTYPITAILSGAAAANYSITVVPGTLTVTRAALTVTVNNAARMYGNANPVFTSTITGALSGDTFTNTFSTPATIASAVGNYPINDVLGGPAAANYLITVVPGTLTITQSTAVLNIAANNATRVYGTANPTFTSTITGARIGDTFTITYISAPVTAPIGAYSIVPTVSGPALSNYATVTTTNGTLTITAAPLNVAVSNATRVYGTANPTFTSVVTGLVNGDTVAVAYATMATSASPTGAYPITAIVSGAASANYTITIVPGTLTITATALALTVSVNNTSRLYGAANPTFTGTIAGALNGDIFLLTYATAATPGSPVGTYPVAATVSGPALGNYILTNNPGTLSVTPAPLTVSANSATRVYGAANPTFTSSLAGLLNGDTVTIAYTTPATANSPLGAYAIVPTASGPAAANYIPTYSNGVLTIAAAALPLTVTVNNATRVYGSAKTAFTSSVMGLLNGDTVTVTYATPATITTDSGTYAITAAVSGAAAANYTLNIVPGAMAITPAATSTTLTTSASPILSGIGATFTATVSSSAGIPGGTVTFLNGSVPLGTATLSANGTATFSTSALGPGSYAITAVYAATTDYSTSAGGLTQIVSPGNYTLAAGPASQFIRGAGATVYTISIASVQNFAGPVTLTCAGLPADAVCTFASPTIGLTAGGTGTTTMTVVTTAADAKLLPSGLYKPRTGSPSSFTPVTLAAILPFEFTGLGIFLAGILRREPRSSQPAGASTPSSTTASNSARSNRLLLALLCTAGLMTLAGCACFTSTYNNYTITVTGATAIPGVAPQSVSVMLTVGQQ